MFKRSKYDFAVIVLMVSFAGGLPLGWYLYEWHQTREVERVSSLTGCDELEKVCA